MGLQLLWLCTRLLPALPQLPLQLSSHPGVPAVLRRLLAVALLFQRLLLSSVPPMCLPQLGLQALSRLGLSPLPRVGIPRLGPPRLGLARRRAPLVGRRPGCRRSQHALKG